jgi:hypothetical protein
LVKSVKATKSTDYETQCIPLTRAQRKRLLELRIQEDRRDNLTTDKETMDGPNSPTRNKHDNIPKLEIPKLPPRATFTEYKCWETWFK